MAYYKDIFTSLYVDGHSYGPLRPVTGIGFSRERSMDSAT
jgi:hypothetical protein